MQPTRVKVKPYRHSSTSKFVVTWCTGGKPGRLELARWAYENPNGSPDDRARFAAGNWKRHREFFRTKEEAEKRALALRRQLAKEGTDSLRISPELREMAARCAAKLTPFGYSLEQAVDQFIESQKALRRSRPVAQVVEEFKAAKQRAGLSSRYLDDLDFRLRSFATDFGDREIEVVTFAQVDDWLGSLGLAPQSVNNYRTVLHSLFEFAVRHDYARSNPVTKIEKVKVKAKPPAVFKPDELESLLRHAPSDVLPVLVIGAFAGLRMSESFQLNWKEVDLERGFVEVAAAKSKTAKRRLVPLQDNAREWLRPYAGTAGQVWPFSESHWLARLDVAKEAAGLREWPQNGLRHSFASYHLAKFKNAHELALQMGHVTHGVIFAHYRELVRPEEAERYWAIRPSADASVQMEKLAS